MASKLTLFDLFGEAGLTSIASLWPRAVQPVTGHVESWDTDAIAFWLTQLNAALTLDDVRTGADGDRVAVEAQCHFDNGLSATPEGFPFVISSMYDVEFRVQTITADGKYVRLFASASDGGAEVVLEGLPVEILLPNGLVEPMPEPGDHPSGVVEKSVGSFSPGSLDSLKVVYRRGGRTSVFVHVRLHMTEDYEFTVRPCVPVSFGRCKFADLPCLSVHDFSFIPSPGFARRDFAGRDYLHRDVEWLRHSVEPLFDLPGSLPTGLFAVRSVQLDPEAEPIKDITDLLNSHAEQTEGEPPSPPLPDGDAAAAFVLDDVVAPFFSPYIAPLPRHLTVGLRRRVLNPEDPREIFSFEEAPIHIHFRRDSAVGFIVESFFFRSLPSDDSGGNHGLSFSAAFFFGGDVSEPLENAGGAAPGSPPASPPRPPQHGVEIGLGENYTVRVGYRRDFGGTGNLSSPAGPFSEFVEALLHWTIADIDIELMALRLGYSIGRKLAEPESSILDCGEFTVDLFVASDPTGDGSKIFRLSSLNGQRVAFAIEGIGWRQGSFHIEGLSAPDGVAIILFDKWKIILQEVGVLAEGGASYLSMTAGVGFPLPSGFEGAIVVKRLRFRVAGNPDAPSPKLDGFFGRLKGGSVLIEFGGFFTDRREGDTRVREFGLTGTVGFKVGAIDYRGGLDLLIGSRESPAETFDYFMIQLFARGSLTICWFELRGVRLLFADDLQPKLAPLDRESRDLRYFSWYKSTNPTDVPGDRRLAAWQPKQDAWALGIGLNASIAGLGKAIELGVFVLGVSGPDERGLLIVGEVFLFKDTSSGALSPPDLAKPVGFFALEWDGKNDRFSLVIGVELKIEDFVSNPPEWSRNVAKLTGTLFISNDPGTFAIGRLADMRTWLSLVFDIDLFFFKSFIQFGLCIEYVEGPAGPKGFGLVVRIEGGVNGGFIRLTYRAGFGLMVLTFQTGSSDYAAAILIELALRIVLFKFLRFGISTSVDYRLVGADPSRGELRVRVTLETPWYLPDVTWTFEIVHGSLAPDDLATAVAPLRVAAGRDTLTLRTSALHLERFDPDWNGEGAAPTFSVNQLRAAVRPEAERLANFAAADPRPIPTDSTISVEWSVAVNDRLALGSGFPPNLGDQSAGDLTLSYDLVRIAVRRRSRFGLDRSWHTLEDRVELTADFSDPAGVDLSGSFGPQELTKFWDTDVRIGGQQATKKLLINAVAPFEFQTSNPEADEETIQQNPHWPCCDPRDKKQPYRLHVVDFMNEPLGADIFGPRLYSGSQSRFTMLRPAYAFAEASAPDEVYAFVQSAGAGPVFRAELDEDAAVCSVRVVWRIPPSTVIRLEVFAFDAAGAVVGQTTVAPAASGFTNVILAGQGPIRRIEGRVLVHSGVIGLPSLVAAAQAFGTPVGVVRSVYVGLRDYLNYLVSQQNCGAHGDDFTQGYEGRGKLFFLPNHEYEIALTTRVTVAHPSVEPPAADVEEFIYFRTKGLPGLNAVGRVGEEVEPYVNSAYAGGRGALYREEPVTLAFNEDFHVAVPLALRPPGASEERTTLLRMQLLVQPDVAATLRTTYTTTTPDWIVDNRTFPVVGSPTTWEGVLTASASLGSTMRSTNPFRARLAGLTQRAGISCELGDPRDVVRTVLVAPPQGSTDESRPGEQLWPASTSYTARVKCEGSGFVDRRGWEPADVTAFDFALDAAGGGGAAWSVSAGELRVEDGNARRFAIFGEPTWNHLSVEVGVRTGIGPAGVGFALPAGDVPSRGLFAVVEEVGGARRLAIYRRDSGVGFEEVAHAALEGAADPEEPVTLAVTAYDDVLRASVGEVTVEADRDELREGRMCLLAAGSAQFTSLQVAGLDIYLFPFAVSRFISFEDHVQSFNGTPDVIEPNALGPGTTTTTTAALWAATQEAVAAAMQPGADAAARQSLFDRWVRELGLPLKDELTELELSRFLVGAQTELFLVESPEPLDFTEEITLALSERVRVIGPPPGLFDDILPGFLDLPRQPSPRPAGPRPRVEGVRELLRREAISDLLETLSARGREGTAPPAEAAPARLIINDLTRTGDALHAELDPASLPVGAFAGRRVVFVEAVGTGGERRLRFYAGRVERRGGRRAVVRARETDELVVRPGEASSVVSAELAGLEPGRVVIVDAGFRDILGGFRPLYFFRPVAVRVLQDGTGRRAFVIPVNAAGAARSLPAGIYRMKFTLDRRRWDTNDAPDDLNRYRGEATLPLQF